MAKAFMVAILALALFEAANAGAGRALQQALPPGASFGGPVVPPASNVATPAGTTVLVNYRGVGTQNYSSASNSQYTPAGGMARLYLQTSNVVVGNHFFIPNSNGGISPVFTRIDPTTGQELGRVVGNVTATDPTPNTNDNGGYGSIPNALIQITSASGFFKDVTYMTRVNSSGGVVPGNPKLFTLPASPQGVANALLAVPYQADYLFWVSGSAPYTPYNG